MRVEVRNTQPGDYPEIVRLCSAVYPDSPVWTEVQIRSHLTVFPQGQFVVVERASGRIVGMSASLIIFWDDYQLDGNWRDFTNGGYFTNHDPSQGRTLYGAEIMVDPEFQGQGIGKMLYSEREKLVRDLGLLRIRAGARLRGYATYAQEMTPDDYVIQVIRGKVYDPTLTFQLKRGFHVLSVVSGYLRHDPESLGYAAVIEWLNSEVARPEDYLKGESKFRIKGPWSSF